MRVRELESGDVEPPTDSSRAKDEFFRLQPQPGRRFDRVRIDEPRNAGVFVHRHTQRIDLLAPCRTGTHIVGNLADPREQPRVIQHRLIDRDAVLPELPSLSHQPGRMGQRPDGDRPIVCRHAAKGVPSNERGACAEVRGAQRSDNPCRSSANDEYVYHLPLSPSAAR